MKVIAKKIVLLTILLVAQLYAVPDPGRINPSPRVLDDTLNMNSFAWTGIWLRNPSDSFGVSIMTMTSTLPALTILRILPAYVGPNDSLYIPLRFSSIGYTSGQYSGQITINHNGFNSPKYIDVKMYINTLPPIGAQIDVMPRQLNFELEPYLTGQLKIKVSNSGDLPLYVNHCQTSSPLLYPIIDTATVTPAAPAVLSFMLNTNMAENMTIFDSIMIFSDAVNDPMYIVPVFAQILPDSVGGTYGFGDANSDGWFNIMDLYSLVSYLDGYGPMPCMPAADMDNDGYLMSGDATDMIRYLDGLYTGHPPNMCPYPVSNFMSYSPNRQIQIEDIVAHRGEWAHAAVSVQTPSFYLMQATMGFNGDIIDSVYAFHSSDHPELAPRASVLDTDPGSNTIVLYEQDMNVGRLPMYFSSLVPIYELSLHIPADAPSGNHRLFPKIAVDRGPSCFNSASSGNEAVLFTGANLTIAPRVELGNLSGVGELIYAPDSINVHPSLAISCDGPEIADVYMVIRDSSGLIVYTDTLLDIPIQMGDNQITFTKTWIARGGYNYIAGAGVVVDGDDYLVDNFGGIRINVTSQKTIGLPPTEDFEPGLILDFPPVGYSVIKRPDPPGGTPTWHETSEKAHSGSQSVAVLGQTEDVEDEWFIKGPMDWTSVNEPAIQFYEAQFVWTGYGYKHEFYVYVGPVFNVEDAILDGPIVTHEPGSHAISSSFSTAPLQEIDLSDYGNTNNVWFAFRYLKDPEKALGDNWYIDDITWVDNAPNPAGYEYIPGDANMGVASWPTFLEGSDVIRLVRYFKDLAPACLFHNPLAHHAPPPDTLADTVFYAAADANGNCETRGSDITRLVAYFKGNAEAPAYCIDYPPITPTQANFPACTPPALKK
jgi:hypothetical protein